MKKFYLGSKLFPSLTILCDLFIFYFFSQNNNNGGYACQRGVGDGTFQSENGTATFALFDTVTEDVKTFYQNKRMYYYSGSILPIEWTNQHGCGGNSKASCEIVLQYACEDTLDPR